MEHKGNCLLSICIPTFNRSVSLDRTLKLLEEEIYVSQEIEIIVSDNASTDSTEEVVTAYLVKMPILRYFRRVENKGFKDNYEFVIGKSQGKYLWVLGDNKLPEKGAIGKLLPLLEREKYALLYMSSTTEKILANSKPTEITCRKPIEYEKGQDLFFNYGTLLQFISTNILLTSLYLEIYERFRSFFDAHFFATIFVMHDQPCIFLDTFVIITIPPIAGIPAKRGEYIGQYSNRDPTTVHLDWVYIFFDTTKEAFDLFQKELGYSDIDLKKARFYQDRQFLLSYMQHKRLNHAKEISFVTYRRGIDLLFNTWAKIFFSFAKVAPYLLLNLAWKSYTRVRDMVK
jgi:glycosyltransferase involved in cell wall biosynthesis